MKKIKEPNEAMQKGERRQRLNDHQDNRGTKNSKTEYKNFNGQDIE